MTNPIEKRYLKRRSGISLEVLIKHFKESKISYLIEKFAKVGKSQDLQTSLTRNLKIPVGETNYSNFSMEAQNTDEKYFRDTIVNVRRELKDLFRDNVLPQTQLSFLNEREGYIGLHATYNYLVLPVGIALPLLGEDYLEITPEYEEKLFLYDQKFPVDWPIDRIRIYKL